MLLASATALITAGLNPASAQNPPTNYTPETVPYGTSGGGTQTWYCERVTGTLNKSCSFVDLIASITSLANLTSAASLTTTGVITTGGLGNGASINFGVLTYNGTNGIPLNQLPAALATLPLAIAQGGTGSAAPTPVAGNGIGFTGSWPNQTITAVAGANTTQVPSNPAATTSTTGVMAGLGSTCTITPTRTGVVLFIIGGVFANNTINDGASVQLREGTGAAPVNGAAPAGTSLTSVPFLGNSALANQSIPWLIAGSTSGLALATAVWFDVREAAVTGGTATLSNITCTALEL